MASKKRDELLNSPYLNGEQQQWTNGASEDSDRHALLAAASSHDMYRRRLLRLPAWFMGLVRKARDCCCLRMRANSAGFRFVMLLLSVYIVFSGYYSYDLPGITSEELKHDMHLTNTQLGMLFSVYALPNAVLPLISGTMMSVVGVWKGVLLIGCVIACGISVVSLGAFWKSYFVMFLGRALYGLGGESLFVGLVGAARPRMSLDDCASGSGFVGHIDVLATEWFKDAELGLAYGLIQSAGQAGSFTAFYGVPALTHYTGTYSTAYSLAVILALSSLVSLFFAHGLEQVITLPEEQGNGGSSGPASTAGGLAALASKDGTALDHHLKGSSGDGEAARGTSAPSPLGAGNGSAGEGGIHSGSGGPSSSQQQPASSGVVGDELLPPAAVASIFSWPTPKRLGLHHLFTLRTEFYAVLVSIAMYSGCYYTFLAFANDYLAVKYGMHSDEAGAVIGIISLSSCVLSPIAGLLLDKRGGRAHAAFASMLCACTAFGLMGFTSAPVLPCMVLAAVSYAVLPSALYPMIADVVPEEAFTQVYAIINATVNALLMLSFYAAGALSEAAPALSGHGGGSGGVGDGTAGLGQAHIVGASTKHAARVLAVHAAARALQAVAVRPGKKHHTRKHLPAGKHVLHGGSGSSRRDPHGRLTHGAIAMATAAAGAVAAGTAASSSMHGGEAGSDLPHPDSYFYVFFIFVGYTAVGAIATGYLSWKSLGAASGGGHGGSGSSSDRKKHEDRAVGEGADRGAGGMEGGEADSGVSLRLRGDRRGGAAAGSSSGADAGMDDPSLEVSAGSRGGASPSV